MTGDDIQKLNDWQHARQRTEMFLSSRDPHTQAVVEYASNGTALLNECTWVPAVFTAFREIFDNSLDEVITHGHGDRIDVTYQGDGRFTVSDNGRGIPIHFREDDGMHAATLALTETKAGRNFGERGTSRGLNGVGASVVNFCSSVFKVHIRRDKKRFTQTFHEGTGDNTNLIIDPPVIVASRDKTTGTHIEVQLSPKVFHDLRLPESFIRSRMVEVALAYPHLKVTYQGERIQADIEKVFGGRKPVTLTVEVPDFKSQFWLVPNFFEDGAEHSHGMVNAIPVFNGGTHIDAFRRGFFSGLIEALASTSKRRKLEPNRSDIAAGLLIYNITEMKAPSFDSQSKSRIINEAVGSHIRKAMEDPDFFKAVIRRNPEWIEAIYQRCADRTLKRDGADVSKLAKKNLRTKIAKLKDAAGVNRRECVLFIAEGDSAISGMVAARDSDIHGGLPLRGKIMNAFELTGKEALASKALADLMNAIGLVPGERVNRHTLRYGKLMITTDADQDGANICALLINFFYRFWPELFDPAQPAFIHIFDTPLIIASKGRQRKYWYNDSYCDFDPDAHRGWEVTRAKGLAALRDEDWKYVLANPKTLPVTDDGRLGKALRLVFDQSKGAADARKLWIGM